MEQALQYLLSYLGDSIYKIELSEEKDIFFVELNDNTTIDEISKKIASIKDVEIINGLVLKQPFEALGLDADESKRRGKQTMKIKSNINTFEGGATLSDKFNVPIWQEGLYYLKLNNLIRDGFNKTMKIKGYFQEGIRVIENTDFPLADKKTIDIPFNILFDFIDSGRFKIGNVVYENERDKMLLENEINSIKELFKMANTEAEKAQLAIELANTEAEKAQLETSYKDHILSMEKSTEKIKQDFSDTLGGMEAMASGNGAKDGGQTRGSIKPYKLGDKYSSNFDYEGMLKMGADAKVAWGEKKLRKLFNSYEDVNYHTESKPLWDAIQAIEAGDKYLSEEKIKKFNQLSRQSIGGSMAEGGKSKGKKADFSVKKLTKKDKFWHARIKSPKGAKTCKVPDWAETIASATYEGAKVTTCKFGDEWHLQKVMIPTNGIGKKEAKLISEQIVSKINKK